MATFIEKNGKVYVQIRKKGFPSIGKTFSNKSDAIQFAQEKEKALANEIEKFDMAPAAVMLSVSNYDLRSMYWRNLKSEGKCALSGLYFSNGKSDAARVRPYFPSLDRIDSSKGYCKDNVRFVLTAVNLALSDWGDEILKTIAFGIVSKCCTSNQSP